MSGNPSPEQMLSCRRFTGFPLSIRQGQGFAHLTQLSQAWKVISRFLCLDHTSHKQAISGPFLPSRLKYLGLSLVPTETTMPALPPPCAPSLTPPLPYFYPGHWDTVTIMVSKTQL